ncbi:hypothetical protein [Micromonospora sp. WMMD710]|uniref:hypothetical protein n=1 Tax=Micromonospora sp. WMMD710 TaxID=3016085 RepID=UPI002416BA07|nr:hypothetical protein [Micromonospora sp. WMMD710]MDG4760006.1 hypothetical protein [Micromonospora sp. WMMD710]
MSHALTPCLDAGSTGCGSGLLVLLSPRLVGVGLSVPDAVLRIVLIGEPASVCESEPERAERVGDERVVDGTVVSHLVVLPLNHCLLSLGTEAEQSARGICQTALIGHGVPANYIVTSGRGLQRDGRQSVHGGEPTDR